MDASDNLTLGKLVSDLELNTDAQYRSDKRAQFTPNYSRDSDDEKLELRSILGSNERSGQWDVPKDIYLTNIMGSATLDFTDAKFNHQHVTVHVYCVFGSDEIFVPENVNVVSKMFSVVSSVENKAPSLNKLQGPTITIEGKVIFGSIDIKVKRTMKEKFVGFANSLKANWQDMNSGV